MSLGRQFRSHDTGASSTSPGKPPPGELSLARLGYVALAMLYLILSRATFERLPALSLYCT
jgi:hypothetical protein